MSQLGRDSMELLDAARAGDDPMPEDRARMRRRLAQLGVGVAVTTAASSTASASVLGQGSAAATAAKGVLAGGLAASGGAASATSAFSMGLALKIVATVFVLGSVGAATVEGVSAYRAKSVTAVESRAVKFQGSVTTPQVAPVAAVNPALPAAVAAPVAPVDAPLPSPVTAAPARGRAPAGEAWRDSASVQAAPAARAPALAAAEEDPLEAETRLLTAARKAQGAGDAARSLSLLEDHQARFPNGLLTEERAEQRVLTLCDLGRLAEASVEGQRFLAEHPRSPYADSVRASCARASSP
jgi:hypothetical protein